MTDALLTTLSIDNPSTLLSIESGGVHDDCDASRQAVICRPPDINLPLSAGINPASWLSETPDILDVGLTPHGHDLENLASQKGRRCAKRGDTIWGGWFFFNHYFRPALTEKCKSKLSREGANAGPLDKSDLRLDLFLVQHDMENIYMWVFKERPENALGKMQLRSYMNGHSRFGEPQFPFGVDRGFARSHKMQRKHYKGLSNPQCIHGVEVVRCPNLSNVTEEDKNRWVELTGRELNFSIPLDAEAFTAWRSLPSTDFDFNRTNFRNLNGLAKSHPSKRSLGKLNSTTLNLSSSLPCSSGSNSSGHKRKEKEFSPQSSDEDFIARDGYLHRTLDVESRLVEQPAWLSDFTGVMTEAFGPVTAAKSIYEDEKGYLIMVNLPFIDIHRIRVSWLNTVTHGVVKIHCTSNARTPYIKRGDRTFKLTDPSPEHCPPGDFVREIALPTRIPENAELKAFCVEAGTGLEIMVPKHLAYSEEREVHVFLPPQLGHNESLLS
eukprot:c26821_g1_i3 orf=175-1659(+)